MRPKAAQKLWQRATVWRLSAFFRKDRTMGILSEIDMMNRDAEDDAFEVSSDSETVDSRISKGLRSKNDSFYSLVNGANQFGM